jgi:multidrug efflux pump subunit AcrA (membrane-fusion protein)
MAQAMTRRLVPAIQVLAVVLAASGLGWCARGYWGPGVGGETSVRDAERPIARVMRGRLEQTVRARGIVRPAPNALVRIGFPMPKDVSRRIRTLRVVEGDLVTRGALLAELDTSDLGATLQQLRDEAAVVESRLEALRILEPQEVRLADTARDQAAAQAELAERNLARAASLRAKSLLPEQDYESLASEARVSKSRLANAEASLSQVRARFQTEVATLEAQRRQANAAIRTVDVQIEWSALRAPFGGVVFAVHQRPGELTSNQPAAPVLTLLNPDQLQVQLYVDEADSGRVRVGQDVTMQLEAHTGERVTGRVVRILPQPVLQENVVYYLTLVEVGDARQRSLLQPEMTTLAFVQVGSDEPVLWVPAAALQSRPDGWYVRRSTASGAVETRVEIGARTEGRVEIRGGVTEGTEVLLNP